MTPVQWISASVLAIIAFAVTLYFQQRGKPFGDGAGDFSSGHSHHHAGGDHGGDSGGGDGGGGDS